MALSSGTRLGSYQTVALIGAGGMGEVYQAYDTKLGRDVAIKVLPDAFAHDPDRLSRFQREAKMLASLNHPNIAAIYGLEEDGGRSYLVMELVPGETLAQRVRREGPVPVEEALAIAKQIAEALEAAHEKSIVHRDLKPTNVKVTPEGKVKVLDFGLAKAFAGDAANEDLSNSPTLSRAATMQGVILGTAAYMSPEQARGKAVDKRTDIVAFGCVLYELLTGEQAFHGEDITEILAAVVKTEPNWNCLPEPTPPAIRVLLRRCLRKDKHQRLQDPTGVRIEIEDALSASPSVASTLREVRNTAVRQWAFVAASAFLLGSAIGGVAVWKFSPVAPTGLPTITRLTVALPAGEELSDVTGFPVLSVSPDGRDLVYVAGHAGIQQLYRRSMENLESRLIPGTEGSREPFFSPDGQWVGFFAGGKLKKVALSGGSPLTICDAAGSRGGSWTTNDTIYFAPGSFSALWQVPAKGGTPQPFTKLDAKKGEISHRWPQVLPGGKAILFTVWTGPGWGEKQLQLQMLESGERRVLVQAGHSGYYAPTGHLVYYQSGQGTLMAVPMSLSALEVSRGTPIVVGEGVLEGGEGAQFTLSGNGSLAYVPGNPRQMYDRVLVWVNRNGKIEPLTSASRPYQSPRLSPDGQHVAFDTVGAKDEVWVYDTARAISSKLTSQNGSDQIPIWTPDGKRLTYRATRAGTRNVFWRMADGSGTEERLTTGEGNQNPSSCSSDGQVLAFEDDSSATGEDIWTLRLSDHKQQPFIQTPSSEGQPKFSPDGRWLAYNSDQSGRYEIYVQPYPGPGGKLQISTDGGTDPVWNRNGRELFYRDGSKVLAVTIETQPSFSAGKPKLLFDGVYTPGSASAFSSYDVSPDGQRFLMIKPVEQQLAETQIDVVLNWFEELKQRVPAGKK